MIKNLTVLEVVKENRSYQLICEPESPLGELHDILAEMKSYVINRINQLDQKSCEEKCPDQDS